MAAWMRQGRAALVFGLILAGGGLAIGEGVAGDPGAPPEAGLSGHPWQSLFAGSTWYRRQSGVERDFTGVLEAVPPPAGLTTLQRDAQYRLGDRTLYTGGSNHPILDVLVGMPVIVRGKGVEMELEGVQLHEIWPAEVRRAD